jgi:hypothetical protein
MGNARTRGSRLAAVLLLAAASAAAGSAFACATDAECDDAIACNGVETCNLDTMLCEPGTPPDVDGDGVCDPDDNCRSVANASQVDSDDDGVGDACEINLVRMKLRRKNLGNGDKSAIRGQGFIVLGPGDVLDLGDGVDFRIEDGVLPPLVGVDITRGFAGNECVSTATRKKCAGPEGGRRATFKPLTSTPNIVKFQFAFLRLGLQGAFDGPVTVTLTERAGDRERIGEIHDCEVTLTGLRCREF